jgi:hypothetical protein
LHCIELDILKHTTPSSAVARAGLLTAAMNFLCRCIRFDLFYEVDILPDGTIHLIIQGQLWRRIEFVTDPTGKTTVSRIGGNARESQIEMSAFGVGAKESYGNLTKMMRWLEAEGE